MSAPPAESRSIENPAVPLSAVFDEEGDYLGTTAAGNRVTRKRALGYSAVWRGVNLIAGDVGRLPLRVFKRVGAGKEVDTTHPAYSLLRRKPNPYMTAFTFKQTVQAHALLEGNGYALIIRDTRDKATPTELLILDPTRTYPVRVNGVLWYVTHVPRNNDPRAFDLRKLPATDVIHICGLGFDGLCGYPVIRILRETIGKALAARDYGTRYFRNSARPGIALEVPAGMKDSAINNLRESWERIHQGIDNAHRVGILREGVKITTYNADARNAQLVENMEFDAREIANVIGVPPHKVGDPSKTAYNSLESENQSYHEDTLDRWLICWEEACGDKLLTEAEKASESHTVEFGRQELSRVNLAARGAYYSQAILGRWLLPDEIRGFENMNPMPDGMGKQFAPVAGAAKPTGADPDGDPAADGRSAIRDAIRLVAADALARMARRLATHAERAAKRRPDLVRWLDLSADEHAATITEALTPAHRAAAAAGLTPLAPEPAARGLIEAYRAAVRPLVDSAADLPAAVAKASEEFEAAARGRFTEEFLP